MSAMPTRFAGFLSGCCLIPAWLMLASCGATHAARSPHPLDPLSPEEMRSAVAILKSAGRLTANSRFALLTLNEPPKTEVWEFKPGAAIRRQAFAIIYERARKQTFEAVVDLTVKRVASWVERKDVQAPLLIEDMEMAGQIVRADARWRAAMQ